MATLLKQTDKPLFEDVLWNRPVNKKQAKRLLIIGGHSRSFGHVQALYQAALNAGIGEAKVVLPQSLQKAVGNLPDLLFAPATTSGSLAKAAYEPIKAFAAESDGLIIGPDLSQNAEAVALLESVLTNLELPIILGDEAIQTMLYNADTVSFKLNRLLVAPTKTFVKLAGKYRLQLNIKPEGGLLNQVAMLDAFGDMVHQSYAIASRDLIIWSNGQASHTRLPLLDEAKLLAYLAVYFVQNPDSFKALTTAAYELSQLTFGGRERS